MELLGNASVNVKRGIILLPFLRRHWHARQVALTMRAPNVALERTGKTYVFRQLTAGVRRQPSHLRTFDTVLRFFL